MTSTTPTTTSMLAGRTKQRHSNPSTDMAVRLLQWNANGIVAHCQEFQQSLATHNFDIIYTGVIPETRQRLLSNGVQQCSERQINS